MKIKSIEFKDRPFRMFKNIKIDISERITVIAGHNGIGKSTLLGLIANGSELKKKYGTTIFQTAFQAQLHELFYLDKNLDYIEDRATKPFFELTYTKQESPNLIKTCNVSKHTEQDTTERLKVVPRGLQEGWPVTQSAKVPIPTLFLSMSRMLPLGEHNQKLKVTTSSSINADEISYIKSKFQSVIGHKINNGNSVVRHELSGTTKRSFLPQFNHSSRTISLGQDSLSSIITTLASFNKLKRTLGDNYNGGILLIDEIDAGFHPTIQIKLIKLLKDEAKRLKLQIILTSHSLSVIKEVLNLSDVTAKSGRNIDSVVYIQNILDPKVMENVSYIKIKNDMLNILPPIEENLPKLKIYFEDNEAKWFFEQIIKYELFNIKETYHHEPILISAKLGCDNLKALFKEDDYFKSVIIIFDNDILTKEGNQILVEGNKNIIVLPALISDDNVSGDKRTPEYQLYNLISALLTDLEHDFWKQLPTGYHAEIIKETMLDTFPLYKTENKELRVVRKEWFVKHQDHFDKINIMKYFVQNNSNKLTNNFMNDLKIAIDSVTINKMSALRK